MTGHSLQAIGCGNEAGEHNVTPGGRSNGGNSRAPNAESPADFTAGLEII
jgi:hypothetical protein